MTSITIKDLAKKAGVSIGTVDRVLHGRGRFSAKTEKKIKSLVEKLGYQANVFGRHLSMRRSFCFQVLVPKRSQDSGYWEQVAQGAQKAGQELAAHKVSVEFSEYDRYSQRSFERATIHPPSGEIDGLVIAPVNPDRVGAYLRSVASPLPYVFIDSTLPEFSPVSFIGQDAFQSGVLAGKLFSMTIHEPGTIAIIAVHPRDCNISERVRGCRTSLDAFGRLRSVMYSHDGEALTEEACSRMVRKIRNENGDLRGIFVTNVAGHLIAGQLKQCPQPVRLIGYDAVGPNLPYLEDGTIDFVISQGPSSQGYQAIYCLYRHVVLKKKCSGIIAMPLDIVTKENLHYVRN
jgi:LacI family transcriptional regulator